MTVPHRSIYPNSEIPFRTLELMHSKLFKMFKGDVKVTPLFGSQEPVGALTTIFRSKPRCFVARSEASRSFECSSFICRVTNLRYHRFDIDTGFPCKISILARNIDCFDTAHVTT